MSCPLVQSTAFTCRKPHEEVFDSFFEDVLNDNNDFAPVSGIPSSSSAISDLLTGPILSLPGQKSAQKSQVADEFPDALFAPQSHRQKRISESSCENENRKRTSPRNSEISSPDAKRKKANKSPVKVIEFIGKSSPMMIGDGTREHTLPLVYGKKPNHATISGETLVRLMKGEFNRMLESWVIVDCRYPYEYEGGHIKDALNIWTKDMCQKKFFPDKPSSAKSNAKRQILIFHCEFSSERAPRMYDFVRETDRRVNGTQYPLLDYPEIYVLHAGYREFFKRFSDFCFPRNYIEMYDENYKEDMKKCRIKSKTCDSQMKAAGVSKSRLLMSRSNTCTL